jgi:hypothetical protein
MPANIVTINGSQELKWNIPDSSMPELLVQLAKLGFPGTYEAQILQHKENREYIQINIPHEQLPVWGDNTEKIDPVMSFGDQNGSIFHMMDDDHCSVFLQETEEGLKHRSWIPSSILKIASKSDLFHTKSIRLGKKAKLSSHPADTQS